MSINTVQSKSLVTKILEKLQEEYKKMTTIVNDNEKPKILYEKFNYLEIKSTDIKYSYTVARSPSNQEKNRYMDILAQDNTRFHSNNLEYINANWVNSDYLLTQGPLRKYVGEFWTMVWDSNAELIICLTKEIENGRTKFDPYFSSSVSRFKHIDNSKKTKISADITYKIEMKNLIENGNILIRKLLITKKQNNVKERRLITHLQYIGWPDHEIPSDVSEFLNIINIAENMENPRAKKPIIVHCSAGIGRTGTFCTIREIIREIKGLLRSQNLSKIDYCYQVDLEKKILDLRQYREGLVQTEDQFIFCYVAIIEAINQLLSESSTN